MSKLTPGEIIDRIKELCLTEYKVTPQRFTYPAQHDEKRITLCRHVMVVSWKLTTTFPVSYLMQLAGYTGKRSATEIIHKHETDKDFKKEVDKIINQL